MARTALQQRFSAAAWIDPTVRIFGGVKIGEGASLWPYVVIRAESKHVSVGRFTNVQDHVMIHIGYTGPTEIGEHCSIAHRAVLHGCTLGDNCLVGIGATIMDGVVIGENSIVAGHAFVREGTIIPPNSIVMGTPAKVVRDGQQLGREPGERLALPPQCAALCTRRASRVGWAGVRGRQSRGAGAAGGGVRADLRRGLRSQRASFFQSGIGRAVSLFAASTCSSACATSSTSASDPLGRPPECRTACPGDPRRRE